MDRVFIPDKRNEKVLVVLDMDSYSPTTIQRGYKLAKTFQGTLHVLFLKKDSNSTELNFVLAESKKLSLYFQADSYEIKLYRNEEDYYKIFIDIKDKLNITQLVITHTGENRLEEIVHGSFINFLIKNQPDLEIHIVPQNLAFPYKDWDYHIGRKAYINIENNELSFDYSKNNIDGIYFKDKSTDFETGLFLSVKENEISVFKISNRKVISKHIELYDQLD
ncbi:hypothetical protein MHI57_03305 [Cytobacillus sp. FSL K6-0129]|uniref:hypothetical protein n=1 Tax=Cytobacillus sp. FSL K6-0129 TaxID=2921421 RepID=UPI0030FC9606